MWWAPTTEAPAAAGSGCTPYDAEQEHMHAEIFL